ncbi:very-short-patch-repair endonuclease [Sphingobium sp. B11D3B]|nr:very-short-patch-repair endonuclease [Sphingobium sp. B11D3B]
MSLPEVLLWQQLRRRSLGLRFRRQHPIPPYVVDFYCARQRLVVEIDGEAHNRGDRPARDASRDAFLTARGLRPCRINAAEVLADPVAVAQAIAQMAAHPLHHSLDANGPPPHALHGEDHAGA